MMRKRWMAFVDGENFAIRAKSLDQKEHDFALNEGRYYREDVFAWYPKPTCVHWSCYGSSHQEIQQHAVRVYYYASVVGDTDLITEIEEALWALNFQPRVFKKPKKTLKAKGVDIALATDFLSNAFHDNYDIAYLVAGDGDYIPMVEEVKRLGKIVYVSFFEKHGLNPRLKLASDFSYDLTAKFVESWRKHRDSLARQKAG